MPDPFPGDFARNEGRIYRVRSATPEAVECSCCIADRPDGAWTVLVPLDQWKKWERQGKVRRKQ